MVDGIPEVGKSQVLCTIVGPLAVADATTRNGTNYGTDVWSAVEESEDFAEMIENQSFYIGLDHPEEPMRSSLTSWLKETAGIVKSYKRDAKTKVVEVVIDILDTPMGRIANTLIRYGSKLGLSLRGYGDTESGGGVVAESFSFLGADLVSQPSQVASRMKLVLNESVTRSGRVTKREMTEALGYLGKKGYNEMKEGIELDFRENQKIEKGGSGMRLVEGVIVGSRKERLKSEDGAVITADGFIRTKDQVDRSACSVKRVGRFTEVVGSDGQLYKFREGISVGDNPSVSGGNPSGYDENPDVTTISRKRKKRSYKHDIRGYAGPNELEVGDVTVGENDELIVEGNPGYSGMIKNEVFTVYKGYKIVESIKMESGDIISDCAKNIMSEYVG